MSYFDYDPELPAGFNDADIEMAGMEAAARRIARAKREGKCAHGWRMAKDPQATECYDCGKIAPGAELDRERRLILGH